jgi:hypothetical protein
MEWVRLELGNGVLDGRRLINADALDAARQPQAVSGKSPSGEPLYYGYGWSLEYDSDGIFRICHSGAFSQGAATRAVLVPSQNLGVIVLSNGFGSGVPEAVGDALIDFARHGKLTQDWLAHWKGIFYDAFFRPAQEQEAKYAHPPDPSAQPRPLSVYTGTFRNDYLGDVEVTERSGGLTLLLGPRQMPLPLRYWDGNTFLSFPEPETPSYPAPVTFGIDSTGKAAQVTLDDLNGGGMGTVTRVEA